MDGQNATKPPTVVGVKLSPPLSWMQILAKTDFGVAQMQIKSTSSRIEHTASGVYVLQLKETVLNHPL